MPSRTDSSAPAERAYSKRQYSTQVPRSPTSPSDSGFLSRVLSRRPSMAGLLGPSSSRHESGEQRLNSSRKEDVIPEDVVVERTSKADSSKQLSKQCNTTRRDLTESPGHQLQATAANVQPLPTTDSLASQKLRKKSSLRERFWSKSSANYFEDEENHDPAPSAPRKAAYVPKHAASDFARNAKRSPLRETRLPVTHEDDERRVSRSMSEEEGDRGSRDAKHPQGRSGHDVQQNLPRKSSSKRHLHRNLKFETSPSQQSPTQHRAPLSPMHITPHPNSQPQPRSSTSSSSNDYTLFLAQAESHDRALRSKAWLEIERYASSSSAYSPSSGSSNNNNNNNNNNYHPTPQGSATAKTLKRQPSVLGQRIAEYIKPPRVSDERRVGGLVAVEEQA